MKVLQLVSPRSTERHPTEERDPPEGEEPVPTEQQDPSVEWLVQWSVEIPAGEPSYAGE
jgi:hypothetical protein